MRSVLDDNPAPEHKGLPSRLRFIHQEQPAADVTRNIPSLQVDPAHHTHDAEDIAAALQGSQEIGAALTALATLHADWNRRHTILLNELHLKRTIFESVQNGITVCDATARDLPLIYVNRSFENLSGYRQEEVLGSSCRFLQGQDTSHKELARIRLALRDQREVIATLKNYRKDGSLFWNELHLSPIFDTGERLTYYVGIQSDVTHRVELEQRLEYMAHHDPLTGLPNRSVMIDRLAHILEHARRHHRHTAVLFLDLDGFKAINDTCGHDTGDTVLKTVASRLKTVLDDNDCAARIGGDEFILVAASITPPDSPQLLRQRLLTLLEQPFVLAGREFIPLVSICIAIYPEDGNSPGELLHFADHAMYAEKRSRAARRMPASILAPV